jgi:hypothetical protein
VSLNGRLIDAASIRMAENLLAKLEQIERRDTEEMAISEPPHRPEFAISSATAKRPPSATPSRPSQASQAP